MSPLGLETRTVFGLVAFVFYSPPKQLCSWRRFSVVLSFPATETSLTGTRIQDTFGVLTFKYFPVFKA